MKKKILFGIVAVFVIFGLIGALSGENKKDDDVKSEKAVVVKEVKEENKIKISAENLAALGKAMVYANEMHMSKKSIYDQLVSEYGEKFPKEAAQYAVDNVKANWKENALTKAKIYQKEMNMSRSAIHDQLISEYGEQFTKEEADYALKNLPQ